jgi:hypothetical protein
MFIQLFTNVGHLHFHKNPDDDDDDDVLQKKNLDKNPATLKIYHQQFFKGEEINYLMYFYPAAKHL